MIKTKFFILVPVNIHNTYTLNKKITNFMFLTSFPEYIIFYEIFIILFVFNIFYHIQLLRYPAIYVTILFSVLVDDFKRTVYVKTFSLEEYVYIYI